MQISVLLEEGKQGRCLYFSKGIQEYFQDHIGLAALDVHIGGIPKHGQDLSSISSFQTAAVGAKACEEPGHFPVSQVWTWSLSVTVWQ